MIKYATEFNLLNESQSLTGLGFAKTASVWSMGAKLLSKALPAIEGMAAEGGWATKAVGMRSEIGKAINNTSGSWANLSKAIQEGGAGAENAAKQFAQRAGQKMTTWASPIHNANLKDTNLFEPIAPGTAGTPMNRAALALNPREAAYTIKGGVPKRGFIQGMVGDTAKGVGDIFKPGLTPGSKTPFFKNIVDAIANNWNSAGYYVKGNNVFKGSLTRRLTKPLSTTAGFFGTDALFGGFSTPGEAVKSTALNSAYHLGGIPGAAAMGATMLV
jgi:hypothetical protein